MPRAHHADGGAAQVPRQHRARLRGGGLHDGRPRRVVAALRGAHRPPGVHTRDPPISAPTHRRLCPATAHSNRLPPRQVAISIMVVVLSMVQYHLPPSFDENFDRDLLAR